MRTREFGATGTKVPVIGQGTWNMEGDDRAECIRALRTGLDAGLTHVDTAELYGAGEVEELVGEALAGRRDEVFLVSKVMPTNASFEGTLQACERSLRRLKTDRLDCYLLHWPGPHPLEETFRAFEQLVADGKIRSWGVSNFDVDELEEALSLAGEGRIACNQVLYHCGERFIEARLIPLCEKHRISVVAYSPLGSGSFRRSLGPSGTKALEEIAAAHGASIQQVALAFVTRRPSVLAIPKAATTAHVLDNAKAAALTLTTEELARLEKALPPPRGRTLPVI